MVDDSKKEMLQHKMEPSESKVPENRSLQEQDDQDDHRMRMPGPSMRHRPQAKPLELTPAQIKAQEVAKERSHELTQQLVAAQFSRQNWMHKPNVMRRIENTMAKDTTLRNAVFTAAKGATAFAMLDPQTQLRTVQTVNKNLQVMARRTADRIRQGLNLTPDPNDMTNPYNQANPNHWANQQQALQQGIILSQDNEVAQKVLQQDDDATNLQQQEEMHVENQHHFELTAAEEYEIASHNRENYSTSTSPSPKPGHYGEQPDDKEIKTGEKVLEHAGEEKALQGFMHKDKSAYLEGAKGLEHEVDKEVLKEVVMPVVKTLVMGGM